MPGDSSSLQGCRLGSDEMLRDASIPEEFRQEEPNKEQRQIISLIVKIRRQVEFRGENDLLQKNKRKVSFSIKWCIPWKRVF